MEGVVWHPLPKGRVACLTDGAAQFGEDVFPTVDPAVLAATPGALDTEFNAFILDLDYCPITLVDTGCGGFFGPENGRLGDRLEALELPPEMIEKVIFTHLHTDHFGGAMGDMGLQFENATYVMHQEEATFWEAQSRPASQFLSLIRSKVELVTDGQEIMPGVNAWHLPGHTPGHMGVRVEGGLALVGDILHSEELQLSQPDIGIIFDEDGETARQSRIAAMTKIAEDDLVYSGGHQKGPAKFRRLRTGDPGFTKVSV